MNERTREAEKEFLGELRVKRVDGTIRARSTALADMYELYMRVRDMGVFTEDTDMALSGATEAAGFVVGLTWDKSLPENVRRAAIELRNEYTAQFNATYRSD